MANNGIESLEIEINGQRAHYLKAGSGQPVVLVHGGASDARDWIGTMTALGGRYTFFAPDLPGYGENPRRESGYYLSEFSDFLAGFIDTLKLERPALAGHSLGGRFCMDVAIKNPEKVGRLVLIDTTGLGGMSAFGNVLQVFFWGLRKVLRQPQPFPAFLVKPGENFHRSYAEDLRRLTIPTLLVWKRRDPYLPVSLGRKAQKLMPNARLAVVEGYGHAPHQKDSEAFNKIFLEFLGE
jgi:4,5:9,10-diseco-3-hydroxy-5,9,17-trioxoandrosta-1(10),2-diene-4-oate hydrolase